MVGLSKISNISSLLNSFDLKGKFETSLPFSEITGTSAGFTSFQIFKMFFSLGREARGKRNVQFGESRPHSNASLQYVNKRIEHDQGFE